MRGLEVQCCHMCRKCRRAERSSSVHSSAPASPEEKLRSCAGGLGEIPVGRFLWRFASILIICVSKPVGAASLPGALDQESQFDS